MKNFKISHAPFVRSSAEEIILIQSGDMLAQKLHILWHGFNSKEGQLLLAQSGSAGLIRLQTMLYGNVWSQEAAEFLYMRHLLERPSDEEILMAETGAKLWLYNSLMGERKSEEYYGKIQMQGMSYGVKPCQTASEDEQLQWFKEGDIEKVCSYVGSWKGKAAILFLQTAPMEVIIKNLRYRKLKSEEQQLALIERDVSDNSNVLLWYYFSQNSAFLEAQKKIQAYDQNLWQRMLIVNYGWSNEFEKKFGNLKNWQEKLSSNFSILAHCPIDEIMNTLRKIA